MGLHQRILDSGKHKFSTKSFEVGCGALEPYSYADLDQIDKDNEFWSEYPLGHPKYKKERRKGMVAKGALGLCKSRCERATPVFARSNQVFTCTRYANTAGWKESRAYDAVKKKLGIADWYAEDVRAEFFKTNKTQCYKQRVCTGPGDGQECPEGFFNIDEDGVAVQPDKSKLTEKEKAFSKKHFGEGRFTDVYAAAKDCKAQVESAKVKKACACINSKIPRPHCWDANCSQVAETFKLLLADQVNTLDPAPEQAAKEEPS